ncbi:unnamed protein product [marine sediment metagenome]|uniref:Uncharacterized protein n=1 Tax=marine sediment metagenome TaxID=412755 RepID=X1IHL5_9ZZZZ
MANVILKNLTKKFKEIIAVDDISIEIKHSEARLVLEIQIYYPLSLNILPTSSSKNLPESLNRNSQREYE